MSVALRPVTESDYEAYKIYFVEFDALYEPMSKELWTQRQLDATKFITYESKDVGYVASIKIKGYFYISELLVSKEHQGKGIEKRALELVKEIARQEGCNVVAHHCEKVKEGFLDLLLNAGFKYANDSFSLKVNREQLESLSTNNLQSDSFTVQPTFSKSDWELVEKKYPMVAGIIEAFASDACSY